MKIPIQFDEVSKFFFIITSLRIQRHRVFGPIKFFIDSGAPKTMISEGDAIRLKIPFDVGGTEPVYGWGGGYLVGHKMNGVEIYFKTSENKPEKVLMNNVVLTESRKQRDEVRERSRNLPSVLGVDFMLANNFRLVLNPVRNDSYFEKLE